MLSIFGRPTYKIVVIKYIMLNKDLLYNDYIAHSKLYTSHENIKINNEELSLIFLFLGDFWDGMSVCE